MHEATIAANILEVVSGRIQRLDPAAQAKSVRVRIGQFRNVDSQSLTFAFDSMKDSYPFCAACTLVLEAVAAVALCHHEKHRYEPDPDMAYRCPRCGSSIGMLLLGEELDITDIEVEVEAVNSEVDHARVS